MIAREVGSWEVRARLISRWAGPGGAVGDNIRAELMPDARSGMVGGIEEQQGALGAPFTGHNIEPTELDFLPRPIDSSTPSMLGVCLVYLQR